MMPIGAGALSAAGRLLGHGRRAVDLSGAAGTELQRAEPPHPWARHDPYPLAASEERPVGRVGAPALRDCAGRAVRTGHTERPDPGNLRRQALSACSDSWPAPQLRHGHAVGIQDAKAAQGDHRNGCRTTIELADAGGLGCRGGRNLGGAGPRACDTKPARSKRRLLPGSTTCRCRCFPFRSGSGRAE